MNSRIPRHHPPHVYLDDTWYIITGAKLNRARLLATDDHLRMWVATVQTLAGEGMVRLQAWVVLANHYHLLLRSRVGSAIPRFITRLHSSTARLFNLSDQTPGRQVWYNYWDTCIRAEQDYWTRFTYIHNNPIKHGYVEDIDAWKFSSYHSCLRTRGPAWLADCWERYPVLAPLDRDDF